MKAWITKYALTEGIILVDARVCDDKEFIVYYCDGCQNYIHSSDWHETQGEAIEHANKMRINKIASLEKKLAKLKEMVF